MNELKFKMFVGPNPEEDINEWLLENNIEVLNMCKTDDGGNFYISFLYKKFKTIKMKRKVRLIIQSDEHFDEQYINFSDDLEVNINDFIIPNCQINFDGVIEIENILHMDCFPLNQTLKRI